MTSIDNTECYVMKKVKMLNMIDRHPIEIVINNH